MKINSQEVQKRIDRRGQTNHLDYFEHIVPANQPAPTDKKQITHLEQIAGQLLVASWEPVSNQFYSVIYHLLQNQDSYQLLVKEIRDAFRSYENITPDSVANLKFLHACLHETFRLHQNTADGLPRMSHGAVVDGTYIPKGVSPLLIILTLVSCDLTVSRLFASPAISPRLVAAATLPTPWNTAHSDGYRLSTLHMRPSSKMMISKHL